MKAIMEKLFIEAGKNTADFSEAAKSAGRRIIRATDAENAGENTVVWHKNSPISAKTFLVKAESAGKIAEALLYFDEEAAAKSAKGLSVAECAKALDAECAGFQFLALELLARFKKQNRTGGDRPKIIFLVRKNYSLVSLLREGMDLKLGSPPHVSAAAASFMAFAENMAAMHSASDFVDFILIHADCAAEEFKSDAELSKWLFQYMDEFASRGRQKNAPVQWIKPGAHAFRSGRAFSLFGR